MKTGQYSSLAAFAAEIDRRASAKQDLVASTAKTELVPVNGTVRLQVGSDRQFDINPIGHQQLAETVEIPRQYYDRMLQSQPDLLAANVNRWFKANVQKRLWRTLDGKLRAVRSDSFRTDLEYEDLLAALLPVVKELDLAVMSYEMTQTRMYLKVVNKNVERELAKVDARFGDGKHSIVRVVSPSATISDSEVGFGSANVEVGVYDSFCSNLASFGGRGIRRRHVGSKHELVGDYTVLSDKTKQLTAQATVAQIGDMLRNTFDEKNFDKLVESISATKEQKIASDDVVEVVNMAGKRFGFNETETKSTLKHLIESGDLSRFGLYNAVTRAAQDVEDYDRASELEQVGGKIIDLPQSEWRIIERHAA